MPTVNGTIEDASGNPLHVIITFTPTDAPFVTSGSVVVAKDVVKVKSNANDGSFSVVLEGGGYTVTFSSTPSFNMSITVPNTGGPYEFDTLIPPLVVDTSYRASGGGSPEGVVAATPGFSYLDTTNNALYMKMSGTGTTGWQIFVQL